MKGREKTIIDAYFANALNDTFQEFQDTGTVTPKTAKEMAYQVMARLGVQKGGYTAVEEALRVHYGQPNKPPKQNSP